MYPDSGYKLGMRSRCIPGPSPCVRRGLGTRLCWHRIDTIRGGDCHAATWHYVCLRICQWSSRCIVLRLLKFSSRRYSSLTETRSGSPQTGPNYYYRGHSHIMTPSEVSPIRFSMADITRKTIIPMTLNRRVLTLIRTKRANTIINCISAPTVLLII